MSSRVSFEKSGESLPGWGHLHILGTGTCHRKGIDILHFGIRNGTDFYDFGIRNGIDAFCENWYKVGYLFSDGWCKVGYIFFEELVYGRIYSFGKLV